MRRFPGGGPGFRGDEMPHMIGQEHYFPWIHGLISLLLIAAFIVLIVWIVKRVTRSYEITHTSSGANPIASDPALHHVRMRYAKGEITKEEYDRLVTDLGPAYPLT